MKLKGKTIKEFFSNPQGVFIDRNDMLVFIDMGSKKSKVIIKPKEERDLDDTKKIIFSNAFDAVKTLNDEEEYEIDVVFDAIMFVHTDKSGKIDVGLAIIGERY